MFLFTSPPPPLLPLSNGSQSFTTLLKHLLLQPTPFPIHPWLPSKLLSSPTTPPPTPSSTTLAPPPSSPDPSSPPPFFRPPPSSPKAASPSPASFSKPRHRPKKADPESDSIAALHELIHPDHEKREASPPPRPAMEAERYIQMVKVQQQRGLQRLEGDQMRDGGITLRPGGYVVHKKVGVGRFVGIKIGRLQEFAGPD